MRLAVLTMTAVIIASCGGPTRAFTCSMYCGSDFANERVYTVHADDQSRALDQCFADHFACPSGLSNLPKCTCR
jgi:hypothetical protein